jgi:hypothetical protein
MSKMMYHSRRFECFVMATFNSISAVDVINANFHSSDLSRSFSSYSSSSFT